MRSTQFHDVDTTEHNQEPETEFRNYRASSEDTPEIPEVFEDADDEIDDDIEDDYEEEYEEGLN